MFYLPNSQRQTIYENGHAMASHSCLFHASHMQLSLEATNSFCYIIAVLNVNLLFASSDMWQFSMVPVSHVILYFIIVMILDVNI